MKENNEKNSLNISLSTFLLIIAVIVIIIMGITIYKLMTQKEVVVSNTYNNQPEVSQNKNHDDKEEPQNQNNNEETIKLDVNSNLVKKLYGYIVQQNYDNPHEAMYQSKKVTLENLSNYLIMDIIFNNLNEDEGTTITREQMAKELDITDIEKIGDGTEPVDKTEPIIFDESVIEEKAKEIFGPDIKIQHKSVTIRWSFDKIYKNGKYYCYYNTESGGGFEQEPLVNILNAEKDGDYIYIYDEFLCIDFTNDNSHDVYTSSDQKEKIGTIGTNVTYDEAYDKFKDKMKKYKHTFKLDENANYYWVSSEMVEDDL